MQQQGRAKPGEILPLIPFDKRPAAAAAAAADPPRRRPGTGADAARRRAAETAADRERTPPKP